MNKFLVVIFLGVWCGGCFAAYLVINGQSNKTFQNQAYGHLRITNSSNITVRNCTFATSYAVNGSGGVGDISGSSHILIDSCDFNGDTTTCTGMNVSGSYITISNCFIHDIADDGFQCNTGDHIYFYRNTICHLYGCGTDGGCGPCYNGHSDGFELGMLDSVELIGNLVYDVRSTSAHVYRTVTPADFELMSGSQAIGAGTSVGGVPADDFYGRTRTAPYDMGAIKYQNAGVGQANTSLRSSGKDFRFPSMVYSKDASALRALDRATVYDLYGRKTCGTKASNGCLFVKQPDGAVQRIVVVQ